MVGRVETSVVWRLQRRLGVTSRRCNQGYECFILGHPLCGRSLDLIYKQKGNDESIRRMKTYIKPLNNSLKELLKVKDLI